MKEFFSILIIGIALSMDTFSLSLSVGTTNISNKKALILSLIVGIMHFVMPILGMGIGSQIIKVLELKCDIVFGLVLIFISIQMIVDTIKNEEEKFKLNTLGMFIFALGVSLDSFSVGLGLEAISQNIFLATSTFAICSFAFTYLGCILGKWANKLLGKYANVIGAIILVVLGVSHLF